MEKGRTKQQLQRGFVSAVRSLPFYFALLFVLCERIFHLLRIGTGYSGMVYKELFAVLYGLIIGAVITLFPPRPAKVLAILATIVTSVYFTAQVIYSGVFHTFLSLSGTMEVTGQALDFTDVIWTEVQSEWWAVLLMLSPVVCSFFLVKELVRDVRPDAGWFAVWGIMVAGVAAILVGALQHDKTELYSPYQLVTHYSSVDMSVEQLGVIETFCLDAMSGIRDAAGVEDTRTDFAVEEEPQEEEPAVEEKEEQEKVDTSPNVLDLDLTQMMEHEENANIQALHEYVNSVTPTNRNAYTGMFEGYNVIFVVAEGFSGYSVDKERTPTLYKMIHEGFYFKNYYSPLWYGSTLGGEYADLTGLMPKNGGYLSMQKAGKNGNDMLFTLSRQLLRKGYTVTGYHNNDYTYYGRDVSHPNLGFNWIGTGNGYDAEEGAGGTDLWPQSDLRMIKQTTGDYMEQEPFYTYYLTVSGHVLYDFSSNAMAQRHRDVVEELDYSDTTKAYLACQYELELAMRELTKQLEEKGLADHTLIVLAADHVPYDNKEVEDELAGETLDSTFDWYHNNLIIWSASMEEPVEVDKVCYSLDILPTVSNLLGLPYDSRMLVGQDILSTAEGMVIFNDRSFLTDRCRYNAGTGKVTVNPGQTVSEDYIERKKATVLNKFNMAQSICDNDYYRYIEEAYYGTSWSVDDKK